MGFCILVLVTLIYVCAVWAGNNLHHLRYRTTGAHFSIVSPIICLLCNCNGPEIMGPLDVFSLSVQVK